MLKDQQTEYHGDKYVQDIPILSLGLHNLKNIFSFFFILSFLADPELKQIIPVPDPLKVIPSTQYTLTTI